MRPHRNRLIEISLFGVIFALGLALRAPGVATVAPPGLAELPLLDLARGLHQGEGWHGSLRMAGGASPGVELGGAPLYVALVAIADKLGGLGGVRALGLGLWALAGLAAAWAGRAASPRGPLGAPAVHLGHGLLLLIAVEPGAVASMGAADPTPLALAFGLVGLPRLGAHPLAGAAARLGAALTSPALALVALPHRLRAALGGDRAAGVELPLLVGAAALLGGAPAWAPIPGLLDALMGVLRGDLGVEPALHPALRGLAALLPLLGLHLLDAVWPRPATAPSALRPALGGLALALALVGLRGAAPASLRLSAENAAAAVSKTFPPHRAELAVLRLRARNDLDTGALLAPPALGLRAALEQPGLRVVALGPATRWATLEAEAAAAPSGLIVLPDPLPLDWALAREGSGALDAAFAPLTQQPEGLWAAMTTPPAARGLRRRLVVIGVDGLDWRRVSAGIARGDLPTFARLAAEGAVQTDFDTLDTTASPIIWTTIATGQLPAQHGVEDYTQTLPGYGKVPITSGARKVPAIWNIASDAGRTVAVTNWWASWPAEVVNGVVISDHANPAAAGWMAGRYWEADQAALAALQQDTHPPGLVEALRGEWLDPAAFPYDLLQQMSGVSDEQRAAIEAAPFNERSSWSWFKTFWALDLPHARIAAAQLRAPTPPDLLMVYLRGPDPIQHYAWDAVEPLKYRTLRPGLALEEGAVDAVYRYADAMVGQLWEAAGPEVNLIVLSDHGAEPSLDAHRSKRNDRPGGHTRDAKGVLFLVGPDVLPGQRLRGAGPADISPTIAWALGLPVAEDLPGRVLSEAFRPAARAAWPRLRVPTYGARQTQAAAASGADANMLDQLRGLGYIE